ncbi:YicC/YloC family endoribonuclease [Legionella anisa]|uniref:YicC family protein n=1 Tax=Legionella anisa TaxID=28082 RepID=A0AAX0WZJ9_9GAMM|nr:YicC/YloC family endoribonuclease [Legionella anisa]AWN73778.1 YicC family protein [Legionella anisa]KTC70394.1 putative stress-induced protein [Legionella anisa]MCW8426679.1 YicC family protein [Legionella anisa]MCW8448342.1 YicC family protein [Legionella anisa]PNL62314.1 YicC family protein [Legionella anisa]
MLQSMTAFSRVQKQIEEGHFCWEIKSVNHRYLDVSFRLPESFRFIEPQLRHLLRDKINRGKLECQLKFQDTSADNQSMLINIGMVNALVNLSGKLAESHHLPNDLGVSRVLSWPGVLQANIPDVEVLGEHALSLFHDAVEQLRQMRTTEGSALKAHVEGRLSDLGQEIKKARSIVLMQTEQVKDKLLTRLHAVKLEVQEARVEQEIAFILTRIDVSEELDRLQTHLDEVNRTLNCDKIAGRRLDFLMQELNREANTLSSKSDSVELTRSSVEMKVLIEQMREQIQNIE